MPDDPLEVLAIIVTAAIDVIPGASAASVSLVTGRRRVSSEVPSSELARLLDDLQDETRQGPCLDAAYQHQTVRVPDMAGESRWPRFAARASELGVGSMLSLQLFVDRDDLGALNLSNERAHAFTPESEQIGLLVAAHAAVAFAAARHSEQLVDALASRDVIGQAKGMLMERHTIDAQTAFAVLVRFSQSANVKLLDVAREIVRPTPAPTPAPTPPGSTVSPTDRPRLPRP